MKRSAIRGEKLARLVHLALLVPMVLSFPLTPKKTTFQRKQQPYLVYIQFDER